MHAGTKNRFPFRDVLQPIPGRLAERTLSERIEAYFGNYSTISNQRRVEAAHYEDALILTIDRSTLLGTGLAKGSWNC